MNCMANQLVSATCNDIDNDYDDDAAVDKSTRQLHEAVPLEDSAAMPKEGQPSGSGVVEGFYDDAARESRNATADDRRNSPIYRLRSLNNWVKSVLISQCLRRIKDNKPSSEIKVLDFCCGKGGDQKKFEISGVGHVTFVDISSASIDVCKDRYERMSSRQCSKPVFTADFSVHDCTTPLTHRQTYDLVNCQFAFHYSFESISKARTMLRNVSSALLNGGFFVATVPSAFEIVKRLKSSPDRKSFGNSIFKITFDEPLCDGSKPPALFGARYHFQLEGVVDCPEYLVYPPLLIEMAKETGLERVEGPLPFADFLKRETRDCPENVDLLRIMDALELYPPSQSSSPSKRNQRGGHRRGRGRGSSPVHRDEHCRSPFPERDFSHVEDQKASLRLPVGTISLQEWEAFNIYCIFVFKKVPSESS